MSETLKPPGFESSEDSQIENETSEIDRTAEYAELKRAEQGFRDHFSQKGYTELPSVDISSGVDPSVRFIGSHISVMKPLLESREIPREGVFMQQDCLRTQGLKSIYNTIDVPRWGSFFSSVGTLRPASELPGSISDALSWLQDKEGVDPQDILFRVSGSDGDLVSALKELGLDNTELDSRPEQYYRHRIGMEGVAGRNFNIAIRSAANRENFEDIGNVILLEADQDPLAVEVAIGANVVQKERRALRHILETYPVEGIEADNEAVKRRLEDAIITSAVLFDEGVRPFGSDNKNRILKKYVKGAAFLRNVGSIEVGTLHAAMSGFLAKTDRTRMPNSADTFIEIMQQYEADAAAGREKSEDDKKLAEAIK